MKFKALPAVLGASFILTLACSKDALFQQPVPGAPDTGSLSSVKNIDFDMFGGVTKFALTSDERWQVVAGSLPEWITVDPMYGGAGTTTVTVSTLLNLDEIRNTTVSIETYYGERQLVELPVAQDVVQFEVGDNKPTALDTAMHFSWIDCFAAGDFDKPAKLDVKSNVDWKVELLDGESKDLYIIPESDPVSIGEQIPVYKQYQETRELKEIDLSLMPWYANFSTDTLRLKLRITPLMPDGSPIQGKAPYELVLRQSNLRFLADWASGTAMGKTEAGLDAAVFNELGPGHDENTSVTVKVNSEENWKVTSCPSWLSLSLDGNPLSVGDEVSNEATAGGGSRNLVLTLLEPNPGLTARESEPLRLTPVVDPQYQAAADQAAQVMAVKQNAYVFELTGEDGNALQDFKFDFKNDDPDRSGQHEEYTVYFKTTGTLGTDWEIKDVPEWMDYTVGGKDASGRIPVQFRLKKQNLDLKNALSTGKAPVMFRSLLFGENVPSVLSKGFDFTQTQFQFGMTMAEEQAVGGVSFNMKNLPPALTAGKLVSRYGGLFSIDAGSLSGDWQVAPGSSDWITLSLQPDGGNPIQGGSFSDEGYKIYFAPATANQKDNDEANSGVLRIVSAKHFQEAKGDYNKVPEEAKYEWGIIQRGFSYLISPKRFEDVPAYSNNFSERSVMLNVTCDGNWKIRENEIPDFLEPAEGTPLSGNGDDGNYTVVFKLKPNTGFSPRQSEIRVYCTDRNDQLESAEITQEAFVFDLEDQAFEDLSAYVKEDISLPFRLTEGARLKLQNTPGGDWINAEAEAENLRVKLGTNPSLTNAREASVTVSVEEPVGVSKSVALSFKQHKYLFSLTPSVLNFTELSASKPAQEFELVSSGPWRLSAPEGTWVQLDKSKDDGDETPVKIRMTALDNNTRSERNETITLIADELSGASSRLTIQAHQSPFQWSVTSDDDKQFNYNFGPLETQEYSLKVVSSGKWELSNLPEWMEASPKSGDGSEDGTATTVKFHATKNLSTDPQSRKSVQVLLQSDHFAQGVNDFRKLITMEQAPFVWNFRSTDWAPGSTAIVWDSPISLDGKIFTVESSGEWELACGDQVFPVKDGNADFVIDGWNVVSARDGDVCTVQVIPTVNDSREAHTTELSVVSVEHKNAGKELRKALSLEQPPYVLNVGEGEDQLHFISWNRENEDQPLRTSLSVSSSAGWTIVPDAENEWVRTENKGDGFIDIVVDNYTGTEVGRTATLALRSTVEGISLSQEIKVQQDSFVFKTASPEQSSLYFTAKGGESEVGVVCSAPSYHVKSYPADFVESADLLSDRLYIKVRPFVGAGGRKDKVILESHGVELPISVTQGEYIFRVTGLNESGKSFSPRAGATSLGFSLASNVAWSIDYPEEWLEMVSGDKTADPNSEEKSYSFTFRTRGNNTGGERFTGNIELKNSIETLTFPVVQEGFRVGEHTLPGQFVEYSADAKALEVAATVGWKVSTGANTWIHVSPESGRGPAEITVTVDDNADEPRSGQFTISDTEGYGLTYTVNLSQKGFEWSVDPVGSHNFPALPGTADSWTVNVVSSAPCAVVPQGGSDASWLDWTPKEIPAGQTTLRFTAKDNTAKSGREAKLSINAMMGGKPVRQAPVTLTQDRFIFDVTADKLTQDNRMAFHPAEKSAHSLSISCSGGWKLTEYPDWVAPDATSGSGDATVKLTVNANSLNAPRSGVLVVTSDKGGYTQEFALVQDVFRVSRKELALFAEIDAEAQTVDIVAGGAWTVAEGAPSWLTITPSSGSGNAALQVSAKDNTALTSRSGSFTIRYTAVGEYEFTHTVRLSQKAFRWVVSGTDHAFPALPAQGESWSFTVESTSAWTVEADYGSGPAGWLSWTLSESGDKTTVFVTATENTALENRSATLKVQAKVKGETVHEASIPISQSAFVFDISATGASAEDSRIYLSPEGGSTSVSIRCTDGWTVNAPVWMTTQDALSGSGDKTVALSAGSNVVERREGVITVSSTYGGHVQQYTVIQDAFDVTPASPLAQFAVLDAEAQSLAIVASGAWTVAEGAPSWLAITPSSGSGNASLQLVAEDNTSLTSRSGSFTIRYTAAGGYTLTRTYQVSQAAFVWSVTGTEGHAFPALPAQGESWSFTVESTSAWTVEADYGSGPADWLNWTLSESGGKTTVFVTATENTALENRSATLKVQAKVKGETVHELSIPISQSAFIFDVTATGTSAEDGRIYLSPEGGSTSVTIHCTDGWTVNAPVWMTTQDALSGSGDKTVTLSAASNVAERREGVITVSSTYGGHVQQYTVIQDAFDVTPASPLAQFAALNAQSQSLAIVASGAWMADVDYGSGPEGWIVVTPASGSGNASLQVSVTDNMSLTSRSGSFTVRYPAAGGYTLTRTYQVSQAGLVPVSDVLTLDDGSDVSLASALVVAKTALGFVLSDGNKAVYAYDNGTNSNVAIGDEVIVTGTKTTYRGLPEISQITDVRWISRENDFSYPEAAVITDYAQYQSSEAQYISLRGKISISEDKVNLVFDGLESVMGSLTRPVGELLAAAQTYSQTGEHVIVTGYFNGWSQPQNIKFLNIVATSIIGLGSSNEPYPVVPVDPGFN